MNITDVEAFANQVEFAAKALETFAVGMNDESTDGLYFIANSLRKLAEAFQTDILFPAWERQKKK